MAKRTHFSRGGNPAPKPYHYKECGLSNIYLIDGFDLDVVDGDEYVSIQDVDGLWKAIGMYLIRRKKVLLPKEIRYLRRQMNYTQSELAGFLRVDDQTVARWEKGKAKLSGPADIALRALFLVSDVAKPEGPEILAEWLRFLKDELLNQDEPLKECVGFSFGKLAQTWVPERIAA